MVVWSISAKRVITREENGITHRFESKVPTFYIGVGRWDTIHSKEHAEEIAREILNDARAEVWATEEDI